MKRGITVARASWETTASMVWRDLQWWWLLSWLLEERLLAQGRAGNQCGKAARRQGGKGEYERQVKTRYSSGEINRWDAS